MPPPSRTTPLRTRLILSLVTIVLVVLLAEGVLSLGFRISIRERLPVAIRRLQGKEAELDLERSSLLVQEDAERFRAAAGLPGVYRVHDDPSIGYVFRADHSFEFKGVSIETTTLGLRDDVEDPGGDLYRILILGDSVAFGQGLETDEMLGACLQRRLAEGRSADGRPIFVRTAAIPSWNWRDAAGFVRSHYDVLRPDLVVHVPVFNDLDDTNTAYETGHRRRALDAERRIFVQTLPLDYQVQLAGRLRAAGERLDQSRMGPIVGYLEAGLSPLSRGRIDAMAEGLRALQSFLRERGGELRILSYERRMLHWQLRRRLDAAQPPLPVHVGLDLVEVDDTLQATKNDPHPNAETIEAYAAWLARDLREEGLLSFEGEPAIPERMRGRRAAAEDTEAAARTADQREEEFLEQLRPRISDRDGEGVRQIYGGLLMDSSMGPRLMAVMAPGGSALRVELAPLPTRPDLCPNRVRVSIDGQPLGALELSADGPTESVFPLPPSSQPRELDLQAESWGMVSIKGRSSPASCRFVEVELLD